MDSSIFRSDLFDRIFTTVLVCFRCQVKSDDRNHRLMELNYSFSYRFRRSSIVEVVRKTSRTYAFRCPPVHGFHSRGRQLFLVRSSIQTGRQSVLATTLVVIERRLGIWCPPSGPYLERVSPRVSTGAE